MTANEAAEHFRFNDEQKTQLNELLSEKFDSLWDSLLSGGDILPSNSSHVSKGFFAWPLESDGIITSYFGTRRDPFSGEIKTHSGTDIAMDYGSPILAAADGTVIAATWHDSYGYYVKIQHDDTYSTLYAHCSALLVSVGQQVKQGQVIAQVGSTGDSTGTHLHFEARVNDVRVDALGYFN